MAITVPIVSEWNPKGIDRSMADIKRAEGGWAKAGVVAQKAFLPAVGALAAVGAAAFSAAKAGEELATANSRVATIFESMGYADATDRVLDYAHALEQTTAVDEKTIKLTQAKLGTFAELTKTADKAGGAFDRATLAALDMAAAGFGTAESNAVQLGKALNDPIKGVTALAKSGVTFTDAEKERIKTLVESNKMGEAQAIVLEAIEKQVGGTAEATANGSDKMALAFSGITEAVGMALLPAFDQLTGYLTTFATWAQENSGLLIAIGGAIAGIASAIILVNVAMKAWAAAQAIATAAQWAWNAALTANPIGIVVVAIGALVAAVVLAYNKVDWFREFVDTAWAGIQKAIEAVVTWFRDTAWPILETVIGWIVAYVKVYVKVWKTAFEAVKTVVEVVFGWIRDTAWPILETVFGWIGTAVEAYVTAWKLAFETAKTAVLTVFEWLRDTFGPAIDTILGAVGTAADTLATAWSTAFGIVKTAVENAWSFIKPIIEKITGAIKSVIDAVKNLPGVSAIVGSAGASTFSSRSSTRSSSPVVTVNVNTGIGDPIAIARAVEATMRSSRIRLGTT